MIISLALLDHPEQRHVFTPPEPDMEINLLPDHVTTAASAAPTIRTFERYTYPQNGGNGFYFPSINFSDLDYVFNDRETRDFQPHNNGKTQMESNIRDSFGFGGAFSKFDTNDQVLNRILVFKRKLFYILIYLGWSVLYIDESVFSNFGNS